MSTCKLIDNRKLHSRMIVPFPLLHIDFCLPPCISQRLLERFRPQLSILVKLIIRSVVDFQHELLVLGPG